MKKFRNIILGCVVTWFIASLGVVFSTDDAIDENFMVLSIISSYLSVILGFVYLVIKVVLFIRKRFKRSIA